MSAGKVAEKSSVWREDFDGSAFSSASIAGLQKAAVGDSQSGYSGAHETMDVAEQSSVLAAGLGRQRVHNRRRVE